MTLLAVLLAWTVGSVVLGLGIGKAMLIADRHRPARPGGGRSTYGPAA